MVFATDSEVDQLIYNLPDTMDQNDELRIMPEDMIQFFSGADLLVADGQYTDEEYLKKKGWGHPRATTLVDLAIQANVKQLAIFHHDPMQNDSAVQKKIDICRARAQALGSELVVFGARRAPLAASRNIPD